MSFSQANAYMPQERVGPKAKGKLPGPAVLPMQEKRQRTPMSDLQMMLQDERQRHEQNYIYQHGHN